MPSAASHAFAVFAGCVFLALGVAAILRPSAVGNLVASLRVAAGFRPLEADALRRLALVGGACFAVLGFAIGAVGVLLFVFA
jgi:hypothetical protein